MGLLLVPLTPACGIDLGIQFTIQKYNGRVASPGPPQKDLADRRIGRHLAMVEHVAALLGRIMLALGREHDCRMGNGVNDAAIKYGLGITKDEIHVAFDVTILKILARGNTRTFIRLTGAAGGI